MDDFEPLSDFYDRRSTARYEMTVMLPDVRVMPFQLKPYPQQFGFPAAAFLAALRYRSGTAGELCFGFNPLGDRVYVYRLIVKTEHQRQRLGLATLWHLHLQYRLPIVPIGGNHPFWRVARKVLGRTGANILPELCGDQLQVEANRWQALAPELYAASRPVSPFSFGPFPR